MSNAVLNTRTNTVHLIEDEAPTDEDGRLMLLCSTWANSGNLTHLGEVRDEARPCEKCQRRLDLLNRRWKAQTKIHRLAARA